MLLPSLLSCANKSGATMSFFSATAPVHAFLQDDLFYGEAVGYLDRTGTINVTSALDPETKCIGEFRYIGTKTGVGTLTCNDGQIANIQFQALSSLSGYGYGRTSKGPVSFTFGLTADEAKAYLKMPKGKTIAKTKDNKVKLVDL